MNYPNCGKRPISCTAWCLLRPSTLGRSSPAEPGAAKQEAYRVAAERGLHFIPSFHRDLVAGVVSYALELFGALSDLDAVYVGIGMGSGICGLIAARDLLGLTTEIIGVSAAKAPSSALSFRAGRPIPTPTSLTFADGLATREPNADAIATICRGAARVVEVGEDEIAAAPRIYYDDTRRCCKNRIDWRVSGSV